MPSNLPTALAIINAESRIQALAPAPEPAAWQAPHGSGVIPFVTDSRYQKFSPVIQAYYRPFKCASCAQAPIQNTEK